MIPYIRNKSFYFKWKAIEKYLEANHDIKESHQGLIIDGLFMIAANKTKMRPLGQLDWAWYTAKTLATAMNENRVLHYYEAMLKDKRSDANKWKRRDEEMEMKTKYAVRAGKASFICER
jgi:hypothetical protein